MIYTLSAIKAGKVFFTYDIVMDERFSFSDQVKAALDTLFENYPELTQSDDWQYLIAAKE